ncbi:MAG: AAA family ATPase [Candidatus Woesearchaeota archaeon]|jgi:uridine kinase|nr:AAA family ATPase [Candidatus Woesearchaeota archaeon]
MTSPIIVGICGNSCSGKSTICKELAEKYPLDVMHIKADKFFRKENSTNVDGQPIWNRKEDVNFDLLIKAIKDLKEGKETYMPKKAFTEAQDKLLKPQKIVLIDGFLIYTNEELVSLIDKKIYLDIAEDELIARRLLRNIEERKEFIFKAVIEPAKLYENIQKDNSDLIIDSNRSQNEVILDVEKEILN